MNVLVLDQDFKSIWQIDSYESLIWTDRYWEPGDFEICMAMEQVDLNYLRRDNYLYSKESEHLMIIEKLTIDSSSESGDKMIVTGRSLESILDRRIVWNQTDLTGNLQNGIKKLIDDAIIAPTDASRKIDNFVFKESTDPMIADLKVDRQFTGDSLLEAITDMCKLESLGFKITLSDDNQFIFELYYGQNRSYSQLTNPYVVFSPKFDNLISSNYVEDSTSMKNVTLVAGEGEGASRRTVVFGSGDGLARRELYSDARDISTEGLNATQYNTKLAERGKKNLSEYKFLTAFEGKLESTLLFVYGEDFFMGDLVQVANAYGMEGNSRVIEMIRSVSVRGTEFYPTFEAIEDKLFVRMPIFRANKQIGYTLSGHDSYRNADITDVYLLFDNDQTYQGDGNWYNQRLFGGGANPNVLNDYIQIELPYLISGVSVTPYGLGTGGSSVWAVSSVDVYIPGENAVEWVKQTDPATFSKGVNLIRLVPRNSANGSWTSVTQLSVYYKVAS